MAMLLKNDTRIRAKSKEQERLLFSFGYTISIRVRLSYVRWRKWKLASFQQILSLLFYFDLVLFVVIFVLFVGHIDDEIL